MQCHTDLTTCYQGMDRGDWYAPDSEYRLPLGNEVDSVYYMYAIHECHAGADPGMKKRGGGMPPQENFET